jgi:hypothetical protein
MGAMDRRPAIRDTRCWDDRRRGRGVVGVRTGLGGELILGIFNEGLVGVRGLEEREGDWVGERQRGSEVNRDDCVCRDRGVDGVRMVAGYSVPELEEVANATA